MCWDFVKGERPDSNRRPPGPPAALEGRRWRTRELVFARYGRTPVHCGAPATDIDHLTPIAAGGDDSLANLRPSCARCNRGWR